MTLNDVLLRWNFLSKFVLNANGYDLDNDLKARIIKYRIKYGKIQKSFNSDLNECRDNLTTPEFIELRDKQNKTSEEINKLNAMVTDINSTINTFINDKLQEQIEVDSCKFTEEEFDKIIEVNTNTNVNINGVELSSAEFLETAYNLFVW